MPIDIDTLKKFYKSYFNTDPEKIVSVPGRLDFLNTHQDYKGLPVISIGVNLRCYAIIGKSRGKSIVVSYNMKILGEKYSDEFSVKDVGKLDKSIFSSYIKAATKLLIEEGYEIDEFTLGIYSEIPIGGGMGSSAALTTSFIGALNSLFNLGLLRKDIAEYAFKAEHDVLGIPCGRLDQYGCVYGEVLLIYTKPPYNVEVLPRLNGVFIVLDSGVRHRTADIHPKRQQEINEGLKMLLEQNLPPELRSKLGRNYWEPKWDSISIDEIKPYLASLPDIPRRRILFTLEMHKSTIKALDIIKHNKFDDMYLKRISNEIEKTYNITLSYGSKEEAIGLIMTYQHLLLAKLYDVSLPIIDKIVLTSIKSGALGAKISGAGLGGAVIALAKDHKVGEKIVAKAREIGVKQAWIVDIDEGLKVHED